jgi:hypothetical protein
VSSDKAADAAGNPGKLRRFATEAASGGDGLALRTAVPATALAAAVTAAALLAAPGCGGTLEGKYRRGELTSTTTAPRAPSTSATTPSTAPSAPGPEGSTPASTTTTTAAPTSGNALARAEPTPGRKEVVRERAGRRGGAGRAPRGEPEGGQSDGTIDGSAAWRAVVQPSGGRHR